jgi:hypothetical protein
MNRYLRERGDANITTNADLIAKSTSIPIRTSPTAGPRAPAERATALDTSARMHTRFALQTLLMHCMREQTLDALVAPMSTVPPRKGCRRANRPVGAQRDRLSVRPARFPVIDVPAGFTTACGTARPPATTRPGSWARSP